MFGVFRIRARGFEKAEFTQGDGRFSTTSNAELGNSEQALDSSSREIRFVEGITLSFDVIQNTNLGSADEHKQGTGGAVVTERKSEVRSPSLYKVLLHNDDFTPMDFVVMILETYFSKDRAAATEVMLAVHHKGVGICGIYPFEIAETKVSLVMECAREHEHPLQCSMEKI